MSEEAEPYTVLSASPPNTTHATPGQTATRHTLPLLQNHPPTD